METRKRRQQRDGRTKSEEGLFRRWLRQRNFRQQTDTKRNASQDDGTDEHKGLPWIGKYCTSLSVHRVLDLEFGSESLTPLQFHHFLDPQLRSFLSPRSKFCMSNLEKKSYLHMWNQGIETRRNGHTCFLTPIAPTDHFQNQFIQ